MKPSHRDRRLVAFLRQNAPQPPSSNTDMENRLLAQLETVPPSTSRRFSRRSKWAAAGVVAALWLGWLGYEIVRTPNPQVKTAEVEEFLKTTWRGALEEPDDTSLWLLSSD